MHECSKYSSKSGLDLEDFCKYSSVPKIVLSLLLLIVIFEALLCDLRTGLPWKVLYADNLVLVAENKLIAEKNLGGCKEWNRKA